MRNDFEPLVQRSALGGGLVREQVSGSTSGALNPENNVEVAVGSDRSMLVYAPKSGCPHAKQTQVLMVLRDEAGETSAREALDCLGLAALAEERHFVVVFPEPLESGWNYAADSSREDDADFIVRCFAALPKSSVGVAGFNGMIYHLACSAQSSAMAMMLAASRPMDAAAVMVGRLPEGFLPPEAKAPQVAWLYEQDATLEEWLFRANGEAPEASGGGLSAGEVARAWEQMFSVTRRWRNDVFGTYQPRTDFVGEGYVSHVDDCSLGLVDGCPRTWHELVPRSVAASDSPAPLVIYLHGINCCGSYGAEQSGWGSLAARDGFMVVFPDATAEMRWNVWNDPRLPLDMVYILALIDHMDEVHPVDRSRVYLSGFSMGSMFANALSAAYPEVFAGVVALNGPSMGILRTLDESREMVLQFRSSSIVGGIEPNGAEASPACELAGKKKALFNYRMPIVQFVGLLDGVGFDRGRLWPAAADDAGLWPQTLTWWLGYDASGEAFSLGAGTPTGFASDTCERVGERMVEQTWRSSDDASPVYYHLVATERMPHAVDFAQVEHGWDIVRHWSRRPDGSLANDGK
ncbi:PHB depolymerase family esterase [Paratractidigestivibacter sp.]|uniref:PHB depolymerase family esterase n=1 Tax=Paratractidigestivibacter sp. TaxID=2847316 RepID=UPI002ABD1879|nr:PHB depolymerase family esterase [Paratractidigestivibacter sp.]